jgi:hypothetical protein
MVHSIIGTRRQLEPADTRPRPRDFDTPPLIHSWRSVWGGWGREVGGEEATSYF